MATIPPPALPLPPEWGNAVLRAYTVFHGTPAAALTPASPDQFELSPEWENAVLRAYTVFGIVPSGADEFGLFSRAKAMLRGARDYWTSEKLAEKAKKQLRGKGGRWVNMRGDLDLAGLQQAKPRAIRFLPGRDMPGARAAGYEQWAAAYDEWYARATGQRQPPRYHVPRTPEQIEAYNAAMDKWMDDYRRWYADNAHHWTGNPPPQRPTPDTPTRPAVDPEAAPVPPGAPTNTPAPAPVPGFQPGPDGAPTPRPAPGRQPGYVPGGGGRPAPGRAPEGGAAPGRAPGEGGATPGRAPGGGPSFGPGKPPDDSGDWDWWPGNPVVPGRWVHRPRPEGVPKNWVWHPLGYGFGPTGPGYWGPPGGDTTTDSDDFIVPEGGRRPRTPKPKVREWEETAPGPLRPGKPIPGKKPYIEQRNGEDVVINPYINEPYETAGSGYDPSKHAVQVLQDDDGNELGHLVLEGPEAGKIIPPNKDEEDKNPTPTPTPTPVPNTPYVEIRNGEEVVINPQTGEPYEIAGPGFDPDEHQVDFIRDADGRLLGEIVLEGPEAGKIIPLQKTPKPKPKPTPPGGGEPPTNAEAEALQQRREAARKKIIDKAKKSKITRDADGNSRLVDENGVPYEEAGPGYDPAHHKASTVRDQDGNEIGKIVLDGPEAGKIIYNKPAKPTQKPTQQSNDPNSWNGKDDVPGWETTEKEWYPGIKTPTNDIPNLPAPEEDSPRAAKLRENAVERYKQMMQARRAYLRANKKLKELNDCYRDDACREKFQSGAASQVLKPGGDRGTDITEAIEQARKEKNFWNREAGKYRREMRIELELLADEHGTPEEDRWWRNEMDQSAIDSMEAGVEQRKEQFAEQDQYPGPGENPNPPVKPGETVPAGSRWDSRAVHHNWRESDPRYIPGFPAQTDNASPEELQLRQQAAQAHAYFAALRREYLLESDRARFEGEISGFEQTELMKELNKKITAAKDQMFDALYDLAEMHKIPVKERWWYETNRHNKGSRPKQPEVEKDRERWKPPEPEIDPDAPLWQPRPFRGRPVNPKDRDNAGPIRVTPEQIAAIKRDIAAQGSAEAAGPVSNWDHRDMNPDWAPGDTTNIPGIPAPRPGVDDGELRAEADQWHQRFGHARASYLKSQQRLKEMKEWPQTDPEAYEKWKRSQYERDLRTYEEEKKQNLLLPGVPPPDPNDPSYDRAWQKEIRDQLSRVNDANRNAGNQRSRMRSKLEQLADLHDVPIDQRWWRNNWDPEQMAKALAKFGQ